MRFQSEYSRNVARVLTGTTVAQALPIAVAPILTRLYPPDAFGVYYLYAALAAILSVAATGRYEMAILLPKEDRDAFHTGMAAGWATTIFSAGLLLVILPFRHSIAAKLGEPALAPWMFVLPVAVFIQGWYNVGNYWHNREKRFGVLTANRIAVSGVNAGGRIGLAWLLPGVGGLVWGNLLSMLTGLVHFWRVLWKNDRAILKSYDRREIMPQARRYKDFPRNMVLGSLFSKGNLELPAVFLNFFFVPAVAGFFGQMNAVLRQPLLVVGRAYEEVFKQEASEEIRTMGHCRPVFNKTFFRLSLLGIGPFLLLFWLAPDFFRIVFGASWETAGVYARYFTLPLFLQFVAAPLSSLFYLKEFTAWYTTLEFIQLVLVVIALFAGATLLRDPDTTMILLALANTVGIGIRLVLLWLLAHR